MEKILEINNKIIDLFDENKPFSVIRVGNTEGYFLQEYLHGRTPPQEWYKWMFIIAGIFPSTDDYLRNVWSKKVLSVVENSDVAMFVDISGEIEKDHSMDGFYKEKPYCYQDDCCVLDAGFLVGKHIHRVQCEVPWTSKLENKKVLVISPFEKTIKQQWAKRDLIWGSAVNKMNGFELVDVIKAPFHPKVDDTNLNGKESWYEVAEVYMDKMDSYDYDVVLIGAGAYAPVLANHAKSMGKVGITICGALQLMFGILGPRWVDYPCYSPWKKMFNEHWIYPLEEDKPLNNYLMTSIENSYWR
jgi:hypothetical protein